MIKFTRDELETISDTLAAAKQDFTEAGRKRLGILRWKVRNLLAEYDQPVTLPPLPLAAAADLTPRQWQVMRLVAEGKSMRQIGQDLDISVRTVEFHKNEAMRRLKLSNTAQLIRYAATLNGKGES